MRKAITNFISLFIFFVVIFAIFKMDLRSNICLSAVIALVFVIINPVLRWLTKIHAQKCLRQVKQDTMRGFRLTQQEVDKLFYLKEDLSLSINKEQLEKLKISSQSKKMLLSVFEGIPR